MRWCLAVALIAACSDEAPTRWVYIEHQPTRLAAATQDGWVAGSEIAVADGSAFPQPLTIRYTTVDNTGARIDIGQHFAGPWSISQLRNVTSGCNYRLPDVAPSDCTIEYDVIGLGSSLFVVDPKSSRWGQRDCIYYSLVDASTDVEALRVELEDQARACREAND